MITRLVLDVSLVTAGIMRWHGWQTGVLRAPIVLLGALVARPPAFQRSVGDSPGR